jgi:hypothetical protein
VRAFRQISIGQWLARLDNLAAPPPVADHVAHVAQEYNIAAGDIELVESATDPRTGTLVIPPPRVQTADEAELDQIDAAITACVDGTATAAQVRALVGRMGQRMRRRGVL